MSTDAPQPQPMLTRVTVLEAQVKLISVVLKWLVAGLVTSLLAILLDVSTRR